MTFESHRGRTRAAAGPGRAAGIKPGPDTNVRLGVGDSGATQYNPFRSLRAAEYPGGGPPAAGGLGRASNSDHRTAGVTVGLSVTRRTGKSGLGTLKPVSLTDPDPAVPPQTRCRGRIRAAP